VCVVSGERKKKRKEETESEEREEIGRERERGEVVGEAVDGPLSLAITERVRAVTQCISLTVSCGRKVVSTMQ